MNYRILFSFLALSARAFSQQTYVYSKNDIRLIKYQDSLHRHVHFLKNVALVKIMDKSSDAFYLKMCSTMAYGNCDKEAKESGIPAIVLSSRTFISSDYGGHLVTFRHTICDIPYPPPHIKVVYIHPYKKKPINIHHISIPVDTLRLPVTKKIEIEWYHNGSFDSGKKYIQFLGESKRTSK